MLFWCQNKDAYQARIKKCLEEPNLTWEKAFVASMWVSFYHHHPPMSPSWSNRNLTG